MRARRLLAAVAVAAVFPVAACSSAGGDGAAPGGSGTTATSVPLVTTDPVSPSGRRPFGGLREVAFRIASLPAFERCALLAETAAQRQRGLMERTDLGGYDGMLFVFESDVEGGFWMKDTPMPLSIAWFDSAGRLVSTADMEPCLGRSSCPSYAPSGPYRYALEVPQGGLAALGVGPGAVLSVGGPCP